MALWGKTDTANSAPKFLTTASGASPQTSRDNAFFVDTQESRVTANRAAGIKTPGWTLYREYGNGRKSVEVLVPMKVNANTAGDAGVTGNTAIEDDSVADS